MHLLDEQYTRTPFYGVLRMTAWLKQQGYEVNAKRVRRLLRFMGLEAIYPKPNLSRAATEHRIYPYLLNDVVIDRVDHVWSADITYIRLRQGFVSMDGRGRAFDNIFVERLWRSVKYEEVYLKDYRDVHESINGLGGYFEFYNHERLHQSLAYRTPAAVYRHGKPMAAATTFN